MRVEDPDRTKVAELEPLLGKVIARRYRIELRIAAGGFGAIFRALDLESGRDVAIKVLHPRLATDEAVIARFRREGDALKRLRDPHTVTAYDVGESDGMLYIAMELLEGQSLYTLFKELGAQPWRRVVAIARQVCDALAEAHGLGIVHRDLKPANIHLEAASDGGGELVKVLDFGIAKIVHGSRELDNSDLTNVGQMIGTFDYMPPEQMVGGECTAQSDIFTLGIVMYEMIVGERPFGDLPTAASMLSALFSKVPVPVSIRAASPPALDGVISRCLARKPEDRFNDVGELAAALDRLLEADGDGTSTRVNTAAAPKHTTTRMDAMDGVGLDDAATSISPPPVDDPLDAASVVVPVAEDSIDEEIDVDPIDEDPTPVYADDDVALPAPPIPKSRTKKFIQVTTLPGVVPPPKKKG